MRSPTLFLALEAFLRSLLRILQWDRLISQTSRESLEAFSTHFLHSSRLVLLVKGGARKEIARMFHIFYLWEIQSLLALRLMTRKNSFRKLISIVKRPVSSEPTLAF